MNSLKRMWELLQFDVREHCDPNKPKFDKVIENYKKIKGKEEKTDIFVVCFLGQGNSIENTAHGMKGK